MGVDVRAYSMFGVEVGSFREAVDLLVEKGAISEEDGEESYNYGEIESDEYGYTSYSCYSECGGIMGIYISAQDFYERATESKQRVEAVKRVFPDAEFHLFEHWY